jgi:autotransporter-associated beta strand protein
MALDSTWTSTVPINTNYLDGTNWNNGVPTGSNNAIFDNTHSSVRNVSIAAAGPTHAGGWLFEGGNYTITLTGATVDLDITGVSVTAGSASIVIDPNSDLVLNNNSSLGSATVEVQGSGSAGGILDFNGNGSGGSARIIADGGTVTSEVDFTGAGPGGNGNVVGSIEGAGLFDMGQHPLTVGGNNRSTVVSGTITGSVSSALTKVGTGTLTLSGAYTSPGAITIAGGTFDLDTPSLSADLTFGGTGSEALRIENAALPLNEFEAHINGFAPGNVIDLPGLTFMIGATAVYNSSLKTLTVTSGATTITLDSLSVGVSGIPFAIFPDHTGGSQIELGIVEYRAHKTVNAKHHPPGQPAPSNKPNVVVALGANDTAKGLGGNDSMVGGAAGDQLWGGAGADHFIFGALTSPPKHPDTIMDFSHAQHDKIDLSGFRGLVPGDVPLHFIGAQSFAHFHHTHPSVLGMVRYAGGVVQVDLNGGATPQLAVVVHGAPALHGGDFIL